MTATAEVKRDTADTLEVEERKTADAFCDNRDRIKRDEQSLRFIVARDIQAEEIAKDRLVIDKKVEEELERIKTETVKAEIAAAAEAKKEEQARIKAEAEAKKDARDEEPPPYKPGTPTPVKK
jgi:hypothetical protein